MYTLPGFTGRSIVRLVTPINIIWQNSIKILAGSSHLSFPTLVASSACRQLQAKGRACDRKESIVSGVGLIAGYDISGTKKRHIWHQIRFNPTVVTAAHTQLLYYLQSQK